jgi:TPR repeat protein
MFKFLKKVLFSSTFFLINFYVFATSTINPLDKLYAIGYNYSQQAKHEKAFAIMLDLAKQDYANAKHNVGLSYLYGLGVEKNIQKANFWLSEATKNGVVDAQTELALSYYQGRGVIKNLEKAQQLWLLSSEQNDEYAQFNLASLYLEQQKIKKAYFWFKKALKNAHPNAQKALLKLEENYD